MGIDLIGGGSADTTSLEAYIAQLDATNKEPNLAFNGAMEVSQENGDTAGSTNDYYPADGVKNAFGVTTPISVQQVESDCVGFNNAVRVTIGAGGAVDNTLMGYASLSWFVNGADLKRLNWGTANARYLKMRLRVKASVSGNYTIAFRNPPNYNRSYVTSFTIAPEEVGTYVTKEVRVPGCTDGAWPDTDGTPALGVSINYGTGSYYHTASLNTWNADSKTSFSGAVNLLPTEGAYLEVTGVDMYADDYDIDRGFQHKTYDEYLWDCLKWCCWLERGSHGNASGFQYAATQVYDTVEFPRPMAKYNGIVVDTPPAVWDWNVSAYYTFVGISADGAESDYIRFLIEVSGGAATHITGMSNFKIFVDGRL